MLVAIVGGRLQGVEVAYLARKAGWNTLVMDKDPDPPALGLCDAFVQYDFSLFNSDFGPEMPKNLPPIDLILPALEDLSVLNNIREWARQMDIPLAFDLSAFSLSCSKRASDRLFKTLKLPAPRYWPDCEFPVISKPDNASGSKGVRVFESRPALDAFFSTDLHTENLSENLPENLIIQEYLTGPSFSIEIIGLPNHYLPLQVTDLDMDREWDCCRVLAPSKLSEKLIRRLEQMAVTIAEEIQLRGIMDLEVILHEDELRLLEIDARFPSQTPMAVYHASGFNMVAALGSLFTGRNVPVYNRKNKARHAVVEHIRVDGDQLEILGEGCMGKRGPLKLIKGFLGADEAITSFSAGKEVWVATMIYTGSSFEDIEKKKAVTANLIKKSIAVKTNQEATVI